MNELEEFEFRRRYELEKAAKPKVSDSSIVGLAQGLSGGLGNVMMGAQDLIGKGVNAIGTGVSGDWRDAQGNLVNQNLLQRWGKGLMGDAAQRRGEIKQTLAPYKEVSPIATGGGELGGEILATWPVGGVLGKGAELLKAPQSLVNALRSGGMTTGTKLAEDAAWLGAKGADMATRTAGGAAVGGASAALTGGDADNGAMVGGAMPAAFKAVGTAGGWAGKKLFDAMTPAAQAKAMEIVKATGQKLEDVVSMLSANAGKTEIGTQRTVPQILQNKTVSQLGRTLKNRGEFALDDIETQNMLARRAALEGVAPTYGSMPEARSEVGQAIEGAVRPAEAAARAKANTLFNDGYDNVGLYLPLNRMEAESNGILSAGVPNSMRRTANDLLEHGKTIGNEPYKPYVPSQPASKTNIMDDEAAALLKQDFALRREIKGLEKEQPLQLWQEIRNNGGIRDFQGFGSEMENLLNRRMVGIKNKNGKTLEQHASRLHERGVINSEDPAVLAELLGAEAGGAKVVRHGLEGGGDAANLAMKKNQAGSLQDEIDRLMQGASAESNTMSNGLLGSATPPNLKSMPKQLTMQEWQDYRSSIGSRAEKLRQSPDGVKEALALDKMKQAMDSHMDDIVNNPSEYADVFGALNAKRYGQALDAWSALKDRFSSGPQASMFRKGMGGDFVATGGKVPELFWGAGRGQKETMQAFNKLSAGDKDLISEMKRFATTDASNASTVGAEGAMSYDKFNKWLKGHSEASKELFSANELKKLNSIREDLRIANSSDNLGRAIGSNTDQNQHAGKMLGNGLLGLAAAKVPYGSKIMNTLGGMVSNANEKADANVLAQLLSNPQYMADTLMQYQKRGGTNRIADLLRTPEAQQLMYRSAPVTFAQ